MGAPQNTNLSQFLQKVFACSADIADGIARRAIERLYPLKAVILKQGDEASATFLLVAGRAQELSEAIVDTSSHIAETIAHHERPP